jgi:hypothetical protein
MTTKSLLKKVHQKVNATNAAAVIAMVVTVVSVMAIGQNALSVPPSNLPTSLRATTSVPNQLQHLHSLQQHQL